MFQKKGALGLNVNTVKKGYKMEEKVPRTTLFMHRKRR